MAKMGRPKVAHPKLKGIGIRMSDEEREKLLRYASEHDITITEAVLKAVHMMYATSDGAGAKTLS